MNNDRKDLFRHLFCPVLVRIHTAVENSSNFTLLSDRGSTLFDFA